MRKFLSILLAVLMVASVSVIAFSAAGTEAQTATVTLKNIFGETVTETYAVGDTITAYTYLNASQINDGKVGSIHGIQFYSHDVLELVAECTADDGIASDDLEAMFPVTKDLTMASGHWTTSIEDPDMGAVYYNASIPSYGGFKFTSDESALIIANYKVKAAGEAQINNEMITLASSDRDLTSFVEDGEILNSNFTMPIALSEPVSTGFAVSGTATSFKTNEGVDDVTLTLTGTDNNYTNSVTVTASYTGVKAETAYAFDAVPAGNYVLSVAKGNHVTREYEVAVSADTTQDVQINPIGDTNLNGRVQSNDGMLAYQHSQGDASKALTGYAFQCADVNGNGRVQSNDAMKIYQQAQGGNTLF